MNGNNNNSSDQIMILMLIMSALVIGSWVVWHFQHDAVVRFIFAWRRVELKCMLPILTFINQQLAILHLPTMNLSQLHYWKSTASSGWVHNVAGQDLIAMSNSVGKYMRFFTIMVLLPIAVYAYRFHESQQFRRIHSMQSLLQSESRLWPQTQPIMHLNLHKQPLEEGPWAMGMLPLDFCKKYGLVSEPSGDSLIWQFHKEKSQSVFAMQMGPMFRSPLALPIYMQALFVIFCACALSKRDIADKFIAQIAKSSKQSGDQLNFHGVTEQLKAFKDERLVSWLAARHAYVYTYMASLLELARTDGVVATSEFLWLKSVDRRLWYILNAMGRQTAVIEVAAPFAHWKAEQKIGRAVKVPLIEQAVHATDLAISEILFKRKEDLWRSEA